MPTGTVKWFNDAKGYGFIAPDDGGEDLFAHFSAISMPGFKHLKEGQKISFEITAGPRGKQASNIATVDVEISPISTSTSEPLGPEPLFVDASMFLKAVTSDLDTDR